MLGGQCLPLIETDPELAFPQGTPYDDVVSERECAQCRGFVFTTVQIDYQTYASRQSLWQEARTVSVEEQPSTTGSSQSGDDNSDSFGIVRVVLTDDGAIAVLRDEYNCR